MSLDTLATRERQVALLERYGNLLTDRQRTVLELHLHRDWSLAEIAAWQHTSRSAVHDLIHRATEAMEEYDGRLRLLEADRRRDEAAARLRREVLRLGRRLERLESKLAEI